MIKSLDAKIEFNVIKDYEENSDITIKELADKHSLGKSTIYRALKKHGKEPRRQVRLPQDVIDNIVKRKKRGEPTSRIANELNIEQYVVRYYYNRWKNK